MEQSSVRDDPIERSIKIVIESIENITMKEEASVSFVVIHNNMVLGESNPLTINSGFDGLSQIYKVNFTVEFSFIPNDRGSMDPVVSTPILMKVMRNIESRRLSDSVESTTEFRTKANTETLQQISISSNVIGFCSLDLMPILLGEKTLTEKLMVHTASISFDNDAVSWQNLPILNVTVIYDGEEIFPSEAKINFLSITVESIYNPPIFFAEDAEYKAGTIVYIDDEIPENVTFEDGKWAKYRDIERTKRWQSLSKLQSRAKSSKWKLSHDYTNIRDTVGIELDLQKKVCRDESRIEWNYMSRSIMYEVGIESMRKHIVKHKYWPFQFMIAEKSTETSSIRQKEGLPKYRLYQCYINLSELLFPGIKSTHVMAQLYTYESNIAETYGLKKDIFHTEPWNIEIKEHQLKKTDREYNTTHTSIQSDIETSPESIPLISEINEPVFVTIQVELYRPLIPCRLETDFSYTLEEMLTPKVIKQRYAYSGDVAEEQYATCIRKLVEVITESYRDFRDESKQEKLPILKTQENDQNNFVKLDKAKYCFVPEEDELTCFTQYLYKTGTYLTIRSTLKTRVIALLDQKFRTDMSNVHSIDSQNFIASIYTYLVERMHLAVNKIIENRFVESYDSQRMISPKRLYFYAEEAYELGHMDDARRHYRTAIAANINDPEAWTRYAIFLLKIGDVKRGRECCREAILSDRRDKIALLMYGLILTQDQTYREAEIFLRAVTDFYPRFVEGWMALHLFYIRTNYNPGIDLTLRIAEKSMKEDDRETEISDEDPLAWTMIHCPRDNVYMITVIFLMKLHFCDFAGIALEKEMSRTGRSIHVLYYLAVQCYLSHRHDDALSHLKEAECTYGLDYPISGLMGHCHFRKNNFSEAIRCYEFANAVFDKSNNLHLIQTRMGLYYEDAGDYERAMKVFLSACRISPTVETWLGAGIAFYELQRFTEAEAALSEANQIDNRNMYVWKYLCLLNMSLERHDEFTQCYEQIAQVESWLKSGKHGLTLRDDIIVLQNDTAFSLEKRSLKPRGGEPSGSVML